ncbi:MAG TPA: phosphatidate cytidylyltransferase [Terracidiphilus sp.]|jgi:phosphatidate cytidylyltransferase
MKRVLTAAVLIPIVLVLVFLGPRWQWLFTLAVAAVAALAGWEYMDLSRRCGANPPRVATMVALLALFAVNFEWPDLTPALFGILGLGLLVYCTFFKPVAETIADASASIFCLLYTGLTLIALPSLREQTSGPSLLVFLLCVVWSGDTAAYYAGRAWGRHKMAPSLSPGKTWEGAIASVAGSAVVAAVLVSVAAIMQAPSNSAILAWLERTFPSAVLSYPDEMLYWLGLAVIVNVAGQVGDLAESALKRSAGVKDSGNLLPGHGGMLDRIDALLLAGPVLWYAQVIHQRF